jgi:hypothetical protein
VKAAIQRIVVFAPALRAHRERRHRRFVAVVRNVADDRVARAAVRAVREGIAEAAVVRIEDLGEAIGAGREIGRDGDLAFPRALAVRNREVGARFVGNRFPLDLAHARGGRSRFAETAREGLDRLVTAEGIDDHAGRVVAHGSRDVLARGELIHPRPESDALHHASDFDMTANESHAAVT